MRASHKIGKIRLPAWVAAACATGPSLAPADAFAALIAGRMVLHLSDGLELRRLTPANKEDLLFDELVWVAKAQEEHDGFAQLLRDEGVHVHVFAVQ